MATLNGLIITENFTDASKLLFPVTPWQIITDGTTKKLVNPTVSNSSTSNLSFTINCSHLEIDYKVSSESGYDYFWIYVDGVQKVKVSGTTMTTFATYSVDLTYGSHVIKFSYSKDSSGNSGNDRGEVWAIRYTTVAGTPKYLIADGTDVKTVPSGTTDLSTLSTLTTLGIYPMADKTYFTSNGMDLATVNYIIANKRSLLTNVSPKILLYTDWLPTSISPNIKIKERQNPFSQIIDMNNNITFNSADISHINKCTITATLATNAILKFVFSKDNGATWIAFNGTDWITVDKTLSGIMDNGMTMAICNALTEAQLTLISDTKQIKVAWVMRRVDYDNVTIKQIKFEYATV